MKRLTIVISIGFLLLATSCNSNSPKEEPGVKVEGKKGGEMDMNKDGMKIEGKKGGELKMDSNGVKIEKPNNN